MTFLPESAYKIINGKFEGELFIHPDAEIFIFCDSQTIGGSVMMCRIGSLHTLEPLIPVHKVLTDKVSENRIENLNGLKLKF